MIAGTQTFHEDKTPLTSWINITKTADEIEHPEVAETNLSIMEYKQIGEVTISQT